MVKRPKIEIVSNENTGIHYLSNLVRALARKAAREDEIDGRRSDEKPVRSRKRQLKA